VGLVRVDLEIGLKTKLTTTKSRLISVHPADVGT